MDEQLVFKSDKATYTARAAEDLLGGGQTAAVYEVRAEDGQVYALKWLIDSVYEQRFFQEVDWLSELYNAPDEYGLKHDNQSLTPRVYDEQRQGEQRFFVLDLAPGQPLDELLRRVGRLPEPVAIAIAEQLARVFTALHELLDRSYLDFQPRNVFWQEQSGQIMVIDWNLLSAKGRPDVRTDLRSIGALLYRMVLGVLPPAGGSEARGVTSVHERWQDVSLGVRVLLQDLLEPRLGQRIESARTARERLEDLRRRREKAGDDLVREAAALFKQARNGEAATIQDALLLDAAIALDLAGRQTGALALSSAMALVRHNLEQEVAGRRQELTALARAISFFRSGDLDTAALLFEQALAEAGTPEDELQVRRWQAVLEARHNHTAGFDGAGRQQIEALLDRFQEATRAYLDRSLSPQPDLVDWRKVKAEAEALHKDIAAVESLTVEAAAWPVVLAIQAGSWLDVPGETHVRRVGSGKRAIKAVRGLPYGDCLSKVLGIDDTDASVIALEQAISTLRRDAAVQTKWKYLAHDAERDQWAKVDVNVIRKLFEESADVPASHEAAFDILMVAVVKRRDTVARTLLEELAASAGLTEDDRSRVEAVEHWLNRIQRLEKFLNVWNTQTGTRTSATADQDPIVLAESSEASDDAGSEASPVLEFPAFWILSQLQDLSQEENLVKELRIRLATTAAQAIRVCAKQRIGLAQAKLLLDSLDKARVIDPHDRDRLRGELESYDADRRLEEVKREIGQAEETLASLRTEVSTEEGRKQQVDQEVEEYHAQRLKEIEAELAKKRSMGQEEIASMLTQVEQTRNELESLRTAKEQEIHELEKARASLQNDITKLLEDKGYLESPSAIVKQQQTTISHMQARIGQLESELKDPERLGTIADDKIRELTGSKAQLELKVQNLEARLSQQASAPHVSQPGAKESGWQKLYEATKLLSSGVLSDVKNALNEWKAVAKEAESNGDNKLLKEANALVSKWEQPYERDCREWLSTSGMLSDFAQLEQATLTLETLLTRGVQGYTRKGETQRRLAQLRLQVVSAVDARLRSGGQSAQQHSDALQKMYGYIVKAGELAQRSKDPEVQDAARRIRQIYEPWVVPRNP